LQERTNTPLSQLEYARYTLNQINNDGHFQPFAAAVDAAVDAILANAVAVATSQGILPQPSNTVSAGGSSSSSGSRYPNVPHAGTSTSQTAAAAAAAAARGYYGAVLRELCEAALRFHLQVQGTAGGIFIYVPGEILEHIACMTNIPEGCCDSSQTVRVKRVTSNPPTLAGCSTRLTIATLIRPLPLRHSCRLHLQQTVFAKHVEHSCITCRLLNADAVASALL
jgi:hypothetical protein